MTANQTRNSGGGPWDRPSQARTKLPVITRMAVSRGGDRQRLAGLMDSFRQWCEQAREAFKLGLGFDEQLAQRRFRAGMTQEYRDWRAMARVNPEGLKASGFEDDPSKGDMETRRHGEPLYDNLTYEMPEARRGNKVGEIGWRDQRVFISTALAGWSVGLQPAKLGLWEVWFGRLLLGHLDERGLAFRRIDAPPAK